MTLTRHRIRIALDNTNPNKLFNKFSGDQIVIYRARAVQFEIALFFGTVLQSINQFASITAEVKTITNGVVDVNNAPVMTNTINAVDLNNQLALSQWNADTDQHGIIPFENADTGLDMTGNTNNAKKFQLIITGVTTDVTPKRLTLVNGPITMINDGGITSANTPVPGDPTYLTAQETYGLINSFVKIVTAAGGSVTFMNAAGYGIRLSASDGANPELRQDIISPALP